MTTNNPLSRFDDIIAEHARYYGMTVEQYTKASDKLATAQELIEAEEIETLK